MNMERLESSKIIALFVILLAALVFGLIPIKLRHLFLSSSRVSERNARIGLSCCLCFGAGVLFATVFLHILPEAKEAFEDLMSKEEIKQTHYPITELTLCLGFFLLYFMEEMAHWWALNSSLGQMQTEHRLEAHKFQAKSNSQNGEKCGALSTVVLDSGLNYRTEVSLEIKTVRSDKTNSEHFVSCGNDTNIERSPTKNDSQMSTFRSILVVSALSLHGCFEGLELGLEDTVFGVWSFSLAICMHKIFLAFTMGMELLEVGVKGSLFYVYIISFSAAAPVGALTGIILYNNISSSDVVGMVAIAALQAIAGGAILFVVFCEILERERIKTEGKVLRFLSLAFGFTIMACLQLEHEPHSKYNDAQNFTFHIH